MRFITRVVRYASLVICVMMFESAAAQSWVEYRNLELGFGS